MKIRTARLEETSSLVGLWKAATGCSDDRLMEFFTKRYKPYNALLAEEENGRIVSCLHIIPCEVFDPACGVEDGVYIVGAATAADRRRRGYMTALLDFAVRNVKGTHLLVYPTKEREFFAHRGFVSSSYVWQTETVTDVKVTWKDVPLDGIELDRLYTDSMTAVGGPARDEVAWRFFMDRHECVLIEQGICCAYAAIRDGVATETAADDELSARALIAKLADMGIREMRVIPGTFMDQAAKGEKKHRDLGMRWREEGYLYLPEYE
ncbi:MAG: GNAT family N-acetyltransferase [Eubacteriales bacterium]|nr:GNAT family N-acetyltransferase [Eubacteriales bacterium]